MVLPLGTLDAFSPINPVTPFTYRDNATFLTILRGLEERLNTLIEAVNLADGAGVSNLNQAIAQLTNALNLSLVSVENRLTDLVESSHDEDIALDPTNGMHVEGVSLVIGRVYDNVRVFAYFAKQYDLLALTAADYDLLAHSARHFDLGVTYPTINDVQE
jgi:hypothetical protein